MVRTPFGILGEPPEFSAVLRGERRAFSDPAAHSRTPRPPLPNVHHARWTPRRVGVALVFRTHHKTQTVEDMGGDGNRNQNSIKVSSGLCRPNRGPVLRVEDVSWTVTTPHATLAEPAALAELAAFRRASERHVIKRSHVSTCILNISSIGFHFCPLES